MRSYVDSVKKYFIIFSVSVSSLFLEAQDLHFSQFNEQPALINPALMGATASSRVAIAYRNQWRSVSLPYTSYGVSAETRFKTSEWLQAGNSRSMTFKQRVGGRLAGGISVYKDNAGDGSFGTTRVNLSLASFVPVGKSSFLSMGLQGGIVQTVANASKLLFPNQYNGAGYDASVPSNESFQAQNTFNADLAGGLLWTYGQNDRSLLGHRQLKAAVGLSFYHITQSYTSLLLKGKYERSVRFTAHGNVLVSLSNRDFALEPSYLVQSRLSSNEIVAGAMLRHYVKMDSKYTGLERRSYFGLGLYYRNKDAAILSAAIEVKEQWRIGLSYDLNLSRLRVGTNAKGGVELTMRYTPPHGFLYQKKN